MNGIGFKKVKVAFVVWFFPKISETFVLNQIIEFKKRDHDVLIFAVKNPAEHMVSEDRELEKIAHEDISSFGLREGVFYGSPKEIFADISKKQNEIDLVYIQFGDLAAEVLSKGDFNVPTFVVFHNLFNIKNNNFLIRQKSYYKNLFAKPVKILAISQFTKNNLIKIGCPNEKIIIHHMGINPKVFRPRKRQLDEKFSFIMVGRFVEKKGICLGIESFSKVVQKLPNKNIRLIIIGDGILRKDIERKIRRENLSETVCLTGKLTQVQLVKKQKTADCFINCSLSARNGDQEGLPVVIMESAALGLPIIATNHATTSEVITNRVSGVVVPENNPAALAKAMLFALNNYPTMKGYARVAREKIINEYNVEFQVEKLLNCFRTEKASYDFKATFRGFLKNIKKSNKKIRSIFVTGSLSRNEKMSEYSDIDLIVLYKNKFSITPKDILSLKKAIHILRKDSGIRISPQIYTDYDFTRIVSPVLIKNYLVGGKTILGMDFKGIASNKIKNICRQEYELFIIRRMLLNRYNIRQSILMDHSNSQLTIILAKYVFFLAMHFHELVSGELVVNRSALSRVFSDRYGNSLSKKALLFLNSQSSKRNQGQFRNEAIGFIERYTGKAILYFIKKYPRQQKKIIGF